MLNTVQFSSIDTVVNSPTFGQVTSRPPDAVGAVDPAFQVLDRCHATLALPRTVAAPSTGAGAFAAMVSVACRGGVVALSATSRRRPRGQSAPAPPVVPRRRRADLRQRRRSRRQRQHRPESEARKTSRLVEDDKSQTITAFDFEEVPSEAMPATEPAEPVQPILKAEAAAKPAAPSARSRAAPAPPKPEPIDLKNRRLIVLLFDSSSMQPEELERAIESGHDYIAKRLTPADLVAVASVGSTLQIVQDFTADRETLSAALDRFSGVDARRLPGRHDADRRGDRGRRLRRRRQRVQHLQHRSPPGGDRAAVGRAGADSAEEVDRLLQQRRDAARRRQPGAAARGDRSRREGQRLDLSGRHARPDGDRAGRRRRARRAAAAARRCSPDAACRGSSTARPPARTRSSRSRATPAARRSSTPTTSAASTRRSSPTRRPTT